MQFTREELEQAHDRYLAVSDQCCETADWRPYGQQFAEDALYVEHILGTFHGREAITQWIVEGLSGWGRNWSFPLEWRIFDEDRGQVIFSAGNELPDLDGKGPYRFSSWSLVTYAGNDQWSRQEDLYDSAAMSDVVTRWLAAKSDLASEDE
jgi:hypothetical protein